MKNVVKYYRFSHWLYRKKIRVLPKFIDYLIRFFFSCWIPHSFIAGDCLVLGYGGLGVVIHGYAVVGNNVHIDQNVTIGGNGTVKGVPKIGSNVYIGCGAKVLGPIEIGDHVVIGANSVVLFDVPSGSVVAGVPGKVIREHITLDSFLYHKQVE